MTRTKTVGEGGMSVVERHPNLRGLVIKSVRPSREASKSGILKTYKTQAKISNILTLLPKSVSRMKKRMGYMPFAKIYGLREEHLIMKDLGDYDLFDVLNDDQLYKKLLEKLPDVFNQLIQAIIYLHQHEIAHRDIKPENIMVVYDNVQHKDDFRLVLIDFADAVYHTTGEDAEWQWSRRGTPDYMDPHLIQKFKDKFTWKDLMAADLWNLGLVFYIIFFRVPPTSIYQYYTGNKTAWWNLASQWDQVSPSLFDVGNLLRHNPISSAYMKDNPRQAAWFLYATQKLLDNDPNVRLRWFKSIRHRLVPTPTRATSDTPSTTKTILTRRTKSM